MKFLRDLQEKANLQREALSCYIKFIEYFKDVQEREEYYDNSWWLIIATMAYSIFL